MFSLSRQNFCLRITQSLQINNCLKWQTQQITDAKSFSTSNHLQIVSRGNAKVHKTLRRKADLLNKHIRHENSNRKAREDRARKNFRNESLSYGRKFEGIGVLVKKNLPMALCQPYLRHHFIGKNIFITKAELSPLLNKIKVFWVTSSPLFEDEISENFKKFSVEIRQNLEKLHLHGLPPIEFINDMRYKKTDMLSNKFTNIEKEETNYEFDRSQEELKELDYICSLVKDNDTSFVNRDEIIQNIMEKYQTANECEALKPKPEFDPNNLPKFEGFNTSNDNSFSYVKRYLKKRSILSKKFKKDIQLVEDYEK